MVIKLMLLATAATLAAARLALAAFSALLRLILASATATTAALLAVTPGASSCKFVEHCWVNEWK